MPQKQRTTFAKLNREQQKREKKMEKQARKDARRAEAEERPAGFVIGEPAQRYSADEQ